MDTPPLTARQARFVEEFVVCLNATQAAIRAGYSRNSAHVQGSQNLAKPSVAAAVKARQAQISAQLHLTQEAVIGDWIDIAKADASELMKIEYRCCRYCWGKGHHFQFTEFELAQALLEAGVYNRTHMVEIAQGTVERKIVDVRGGVGWDPRKRPSTKCPRCFGEGERHVRVTPAEELSPQARKLFGGFKVTSNGIEVLREDRAHARLQLARHLGMFEKDNHLTVDGVKGYGFDPSAIAGTEKLQTPGRPTEPVEGD